MPAELAALGVHGGELEWPAQGMTSQVAFAGQVVLKRCTDARYVAWLRREHAVLVALGATELPVPHVLGFVDRGAAVWLATQRLPGRALSAVLEEASASEAAALAGELGATLGRLHRTPIPVALVEREPWLDRMLAAAEANLPWCDGSAELLAELRATRPAAVSDALIHGDLALDNVLAADGAITGLIDWPMGGSGDPRYDLSLALDDAIGDRAAELYVAYGTPPLDRATRAWFERLYDFF